MYTPLSVCGEPTDTGLTNISSLLWCAPPGRYVVFVVMMSLAGAFVGATMPLSLELLAEISYVRPCFRRGGTGVVCVSQPRLPPPTVAARSVQRRSVRCLSASAQRVA